MYVSVGHFSCSEANLQVFVSVSQFMPKILVADLLYKCGFIGHLVVKIEAFYSAYIKGINCYFYND